MGSIRLKVWKITLSFTAGVTVWVPSRPGVKYFRFQSAGMVSGRL